MDGSLCRQPAVMMPPPPPPSSPFVMRAPLLILPKHPTTSSPIFLLLQHDPFRLLHAYGSAVSSLEGSIPR